MQKKVFYGTAIFFLVVGIIIFIGSLVLLFTGDEDFIIFLFHAGVLLSIAAILYAIGKKKGKEAADEKSNEAEKSLRELRDKGLLSEEEYQQKLTKSRGGAQKTMDDLKALKDAGILTEEEYQQKVKQLDK